MNQIAFSFDAITKNKIVDGLVVTLIGAASMYALNYVVPALSVGPYTPLVMVLATNILHTVYQWAKGQTPTMNTQAS